MAHHPFRWRRIRTVIACVGLALSSAWVYPQVRGAETVAGPMKRPASRTGTTSAPNRLGQRTWPKPTDDFLRYRFTTGQTFAYDVNIEWKTPRRSERSGRLSGQPYFVVNHVDQSGTVLMAIGRLRYERTAADGTSEKLPGDDYWLGTTIQLDMTGDRLSGRRGSGGGDCPFAPASHLDRLLFPELPPHANSETAHGGTIEVARMSWGPFEGSSAITSRGKQRFSTWARPLHGSQVQLTIERRYDPEDGSASSVNRSIATFDRELGALLDHVADWTITDGGVTSKVNVRIRRIAGAELLEAARQLAMENLKSLPQDMQPTELLRKRITVAHLPKKYDADDLPPPGTVVGYYHGGWYAVQYVGQVERYKALVRYLGSGETAKVHPGEMAKLD